MLFVFNSHTAGGKLKNRLLDILLTFSSGGYELSVWPTHAAGDARNIVLEHGGKCDTLVCCGGDGTLNEVVDGLLKLKKRPLLGYIPGGTTNDFATSLLLPKSNMLAAAERVINPKKIYHCDVGLFNQRAFTYVAAFGAFTEVSYKTPQNVKNTLGYFAYLLEAVQKLPSIEARHVRVETEDEVIEGDFALGMVSNSASIGGFHFPGNQKVRLDDGLFEVILAKMPHGLGELGALSAAVRSGNYASPLLTVLRAKKLSFTSSLPISWTLDGEFGGTVSEVDIEVQHRAIEICI